MIRKPAAVLFVLSVAALALALVPAAGLAAKGGNAGASGKPSGGGSTTSTSRISLASPLVLDANGNGAPNWNDRVTFDVSTTATDKPWVRLDCYQSGNWVSTATAGFFPDYPWAPNYTLASGAWTSGAGDCDAKLYAVTSNGRTRALASMTFHVDA